MEYVTDVLQNTAQDIFEVKRDDGKTVLIPKVDAVCTENRWKRAVDHGDADRGVLRIYSFGVKRMKIDVLTLFPEMFRPVMESSMLGRAVAAGILQIKASPTYGSSAMTSTIRRMIIPSEAEAAWS